jgi:predicted DCC family thiol-disulfide oxidoreductase YuxK
MRHSETDVIVLRVEQNSRPAAEDKRKHTVYFDGSCPLCSAEIGHYASLDRNNRVSFVDVSDEDADLGSDRGSDDARRRFHVRLPDGTLLSGARAFIAVWRTLPGWRRLAPMAALPGVPVLMEGLYRAFLLIRPTLSRLAVLFGARPANPNSTRS